MSTGRERKKDKALEDFFEEAVIAVQAVIQFSLWPVKADSKAGGLFENLLRSLALFGLLTGGFWLYSFADKKSFSPWIVLGLLAVSAFVFVLRLWVFSRFPKQSMESRKITVEDLKPKKLNFERLPRLLEDSLNAPVGLSLISKKPVLLNVQDRVQHTIISGATGQGKTTLMKTLLSHSFRHGHPVIIIDPKGEREDILAMQRKARFYGREKDFLLFSLAFPEGSHSYNPLENGTAEQIKARLMDGLRFEEEYYRSRSAFFLGGILSAFRFLNRPVSFFSLDKALNNKNEVQSLKESVSSMEVGGDSPENQKAAEELTALLEQIQKIPEKDLAGLQAQIASINCLEFRKILSGADSNSDKSGKQSAPALSLEECLGERKIAYFQMNVNGYGEISRQIGRMILQDLKVLSNRIQAGQGDFSYPFAACFVDEFGSFATGDFADFLKMARSSRIGISLFCQGLSDLSRISPDFKNQIIGNTAAKILFRQDVGQDAEEWAETAGTFTSWKKTYQVSDAETEEEMTGLGSVREVKEMKIEFDVFKRLSPGQVVLIDKARHREDLFQVWRPVL